MVSPYLTHITERISFPGASPDADPAFRAWGDAELVSVERPYQVTWQVSLRLKRTFLAGESATYSFQSQAPSRRLLHPMSVMLPERVCRVFSTEVNFGSPSVATRVWRLDGVPAPVAELDTPSGVLLDPVSYTHLGRPRWSLAGKGSAGGQRDRSFATVAASDRCRGDLVDMAADSGWSAATRTPGWRAPATACHPGS